MTVPERLYAINGLETAALMLYKNCMFLELLYYSEKGE